jgi:hypothetical protein
MRSDSAAEPVLIEIDPSAEPIAGVVRHGSGPARSFSGWLELVALLESERQLADGANPPLDAA